MKIDDFYKKVAYSNQELVRDIPSGACDLDLTQLMEKFVKMSMLDIFEKCFSDGISIEDNAMTISPLEYREMVKKLEDYIETNL